MTPRHLTSGADAVRAANRLKTPTAPSPPVPFPWDLPPKNSKPVCKSFSIVAPAVATPTVVVQYTVPDGFQFVLTDRVNAYAGSAFIQGSGYARWTTDVNVTPGIVTPQGFPVEGMAGETFACGSLEFPWPVRGYLVFEPLDVIRVKVTTTAPITAGSPNFFTSVLLGWIWPLK